ncbi:hypothetical protein UH38_18245 [Aliterella atlantica CENA595]|uniref:Uncharacterized protein n=2 Tax=Aliterella TaxID=1827277 RepID=A0A0D8ZPH8_9CYAN|nr:hypothetical protein UH38_18245 [Aliterella atlantica CENA595]
MSRDEIAALVENVSSKASQYIGNKSQGDWFLKQLVRAQGFDGLPHIVTKQDLKKIAKIISYHKLLEEQDKDFLKALLELKEPSHYAAFKGYDVIDLGATKNQPKYMVILNRTALRAQDESIAGVEQ